MRNFMLPWWRAIKVLWGHISNVSVRKRSRPFNWIPEYREAHESQMAQTLPVKENHFATNRSTTSIYCRHDSAIQCQGRLVFPMIKCEFWLPSKIEPLHRSTWIFKQLIRLIGSPVNALNLVDIRLLGFARQICGTHAFVTFLSICFPSSRTRVERLNRFSAVRVRLVKKKFIR